MTDIAKPTHDLPGWGTAVDALFDTLNAAGGDALAAAITAKAADNAVVKLTGAQTVAGVKTFSSAPVVPSAAFPESAVSGLVSDLAAKQPLDSDLTAIAGLSATDNDVIQRKSGAWTNRTPTQLRADLTIGQSYLIAYAVGASGQATASTYKVVWGTGGGSAPAIVGADLEINTGDHSKISVLTSGLYSIDYWVGLNTAANFPGPIDGAQALIRIFGSQNANLDQIVVPYGAGGLVGAVPHAHLTQWFAASDYFNFYVYAENNKKSQTVGTTSGSATVTNPLIQATDLGAPITGTGIPANSFVGTVTPGVSFLLSSANSSQSNVNATATASVVAQIGPRAFNVESIFTCINIVRLA